MRRCSAKAAARMLRDLLAKDVSLPPAIAANVLTAADLLEALPEPEPAPHSAPPAAKRQKRAQAQGGSCKPMVPPVRLSVA